MIIAAADGSAIGNPGPTGWAWYVDDTCWASGGWPHGTNNMGELMAVLDLLQQTAHLDDDLLVYCDSTYVINAITKWMPGWKRKGWKTGGGQPVKNVELMKAIDAAMRPNVKFEWVKGHAGHPLNEAADVRANAASSAYRDGRLPDPGPGFVGSSTAHPAATVGQVEPELDLFSEMGGGLEDAGEPAPVRPGEPEVVSVEMTSPDSIVLVWRAAGNERAPLRRSRWTRSGDGWQPG